MANCNGRKTSEALWVSFMVVSCFLPHYIANPLNFSFIWFKPNIVDMDYQGNATATSGEIQLTTNQIDEPLQQSVGRAIYYQPLHLWNSKTNKPAHFTTHFVFTIKSINQGHDGDGLAFFLAANGSVLPSDSAGGCLGLFSEKSKNDSSTNKIVAVEFDSFPNDWDPRGDHVGINVNSIVSKEALLLNSSINDGRTANASVSYNGSTHNLSVFLSYNSSEEYSLHYVVDLMKTLPEWVDIGFSAATGDWIELHQIQSWSFSASDVEEVAGSDVHKAGGRRIAIGLSVSMAVLISVLGMALLGIWRRWRRRRRENVEDLNVEVSMDNEFQKGTGPKRFFYNELALATNDFAEEGKLGEGGFGGVYRGFLSESNTSIAVKRMAQRSQQGKKEYMAEVKIISRLRHRNLVQLVGWCHEQNDFLLVYDFMPNGSLDSHLFGGKSLLNWGARFNIAHGLAHALLYLHEGWEQCVVHRDIKSSNVMLDSIFNARLGDFGLARLVDHGLGSQTTVLAGTMGYLAPESVFTGRASKESDVYSFGIVALEIACGRRVIEHKEEAKKVRLVEWVWDLYGRGRLLDAADGRLSRDFDERGMECLLVVGLWCAQPDSNLRPSIGQVINVLDSEAPLPNLPSQMPVLMYFAPPAMDLCGFSGASSIAVMTDPGKDWSKGLESGSTTSTNLSRSNLSSSCASSTPLLVPEDFHPPDPGNLEEKV